MRLYSTLFLLLISSILSCSFFEEGTSILWTDTLEIIPYIDFFNSQQSSAKIIVSYKEDLLQELDKTNKLPDIVIGKYLNNNKTVHYFQSLDNFFSDLIIDDKIFYSSLLSAGNFTGRQFFIPVSFNIPTMVVNEDYANSIPSGTTISIDELKKLSLVYNNENQGKIGFSPRWDSNLLLIILQLFDVEYKEDNPIYFDKNKLSTFLKWVYEYSVSINSSQESETLYKLININPDSYKSVLKKDILCTYMPSNIFFSISEQQRMSLNFRWLSYNQTIVPEETIVFLGLCSKMISKRSSDTFIKWLFSIKTQEEILNRNSKTNTSKKLFGIASGFSSIVQINENCFTQNYPFLIGRIPLKETIKKIQPLQSYWPSIKKIVMTEIENYLEVKNQSNENFEILSKNIELKLKKWKVLQIESKND